MATNHTTNYNLNLWEPTDAFLREEFNENTNKIDAALAGKLGQVELAGGGTSDKVTGRTFTTFPAGEPSDWSITAMLCTADPINSSDETEIEFKINDIYKPELIGTSKTTPVLIVFFPLHDENRPIQGIMFGSSVIPFVLDTPFKGHRVASLGLTNHDYMTNVCTQHFGIR